MKFIDCVIKQNILTPRSSELGVPIALFLFEWGWARATSSEGVDVNVMSVFGSPVSRHGPTVAVHRSVCLCLGLNPASGNVRMAKGAMNLAMIDDIRGFSGKWEMRDGLRQMAWMWYFLGNLFRRNIWKH